MYTRTLVLHVNGASGTAGWGGVGCTLYFYSERDEDEKRGRTDIDTRTSGLGRGRGRGRGIRDKGRGAYEERYSGYEAGALTLPLRPELKDFEDTETGRGACQRLPTRTYPPPRAQFTYTPARDSRARTVTSRIYARAADGGNASGSRKRNVDINDDDDDGDGDDRVLRDTLKLDQGEEANWISWKEETSTGRILKRRIKAGYESSRARRIGIRKLERRNECLAAVRGKQPDEEGRRRQVGSGKQLSIKAEYPSRGELDFLEFEEGVVDKPIVSGGASGDYHDTTP
ncbi:hypothetical protein FB451DRAFT_1185353 [Mycena latifolia]|nr:hypothetical protein FB451DRAFT_1185353 [Mycena latifolia]